MTVRESLKDLTILGAIFGAQAKKLTGLCDKNYTITDSMTFTAPDSILLANAPSSFLQPGSYFRITGGGGANENVLFKVLHISGPTVTVDTSVNSIQNEPIGTATIDARLATVVADETIAKIGCNGSTIFNVNKCVSLGFGHCFGVAGAYAEHYHDVPTSAQPPYCFNINIPDWVSCDGGDNYCFDVVHNLDTICPDTTIFEGGSEVQLQTIEIVDSNTIRLKVSQAYSDCRFTGSGVISSH